MREIDGNPPSNILGPGIDEADVSASILSSGYPLQVVVAQQFLSRNFYVQQEWSYVDRDTSTLRAIDCFASKRYWEHEKNQPRARPELDLIVECKQSPLPYVFFSAGESGVISHF